MQNYLFNFVIQGNLWMICTFHFDNKTNSFLQLHGRYCKAKIFSQVVPRPVEENPGKMVPEKWSPEKTNPGKTVPEKNGPRKNGPRKNGPRKIGPPETQKRKIVGWASTIVVCVCGMFGCDQSMETQHSTQTQNSEINPKLGNKKWWGERRASWRVCGIFGSDQSMKTQNSTTNHPGLL